MAADSSAGVEFHGGKPGTVPNYTILRIPLHDPLNRVTMAEEKAGGTSFTPTCPDSGSVWCRQFGYDNAGNRWARCSCWRTSTVPDSWVNSSRHVGQALGGNWGDSGG